MSQVKRNSVTSRGSKEIRKSVGSNNKFSNPALVVNGSTNQFGDRKSVNSLQVLSQMKVDDIQSFQVTPSTQNTNEINKGGRSMANLSSVDSLKKRTESFLALKSNSSGDRGSTSQRTLQETFLKNVDLKSVATDNVSVLSAIKSVNTEELPNISNDFKYAKLFLQKQGINNLSIWSHLTDILNKIIAEQPENVIDYFEEYSKKVKQEKLVIYDTLRDVFIPPAQLESAKNQLVLLNSYGLKEDTDEPEAVGEEEEKVELPKKMDLEEAAFYFRLTGLAIPNVQLFNLNVAIKKLVQEKNLIQPRFWGKLFGTTQDYFVLECELTDEEYEKRIEEEELAEMAEAERIAAEQEAEQAAEEEEKGADVQEEILLERDEKNIQEEIKEGETTVQEGETTEEEVKEEESKDRTSIRKSVPEVTFDLPPEENQEEEEGEKEDPLLPPLPPPRKLLKYKIPPILKPVPKEIIKIIPEKLGEGLNRKVYYVANTPELEWSELPKITPDEINCARQIKVFFTGDLESKLFTYPAFPGAEKNYLRAQIARISAATQISPLGFYRLGEGGGDEEEEEEEAPEEEEEAQGDKTKITENPKFKPIPVKDLTDPSFSFWVHHSQHILKQGRTKWWSPKKAPTDEEEAEEEQEEEEEEEKGEEGKETGPALLTPVSEDAEVEGHPAWSVRKTHDYNMELTAAVMRSNLWPGASAFAVGKKFENIYFGWGHKHLPQGFSPVPLPHPEYEYDLGPEIMEIQDPTVEVEEAWRQAHKKKPPPKEGEEGEEEAEEEEEEEDEDD